MVPWACNGLPTSGWLRTGSKRDEHEKLTAAVH